MLFAFISLTYAQIWDVTTSAGTRNPGFTNGPGLSASFRNPYGVAVDLSGNTFVTDFSNNVIRVINSTGFVSTFAGSGILGFNNGPGSTATFNSPYSVAVDPVGNVFVSDGSNNATRKINTTGHVFTIAGTGSPGFNNGPGNTATFNGPQGIAVDSFENVYVADQINQVIRKIDSNGIVSTYAGTGFPGFGNGLKAIASFDAPNGVAVDVSGNVYVADFNNNAVRKIDSSGFVSTLAGNGSLGFKDGPGIAATFNKPTNVAVDYIGNVYVADLLNNAIRIINSTGQVFQSIGNGGQGFNDGLEATATFYQPTSVAVDPHGNVYVADSFNIAIRKANRLLQVKSIYNNFGPAGSPFVVTLLSLNQGSFLSLSFKLAQFYIEATNCTATNLTISCFAPTVPFSANYDIIVTADSTPFGIGYSLPFNGYSYDPAAITSMSPTMIDTQRGTLISINGLNFGEGCCQVIPIVYFGNTTCTDAVRINDTLITCYAPPGVGEFVPSVHLNFTYQYLSSYNPYIGCYVDNENRLGGPGGGGSIITVEICRTSCANYIYAGLENGSQCFCGNDLAFTGGIAPSTDCSSICNGNPVEVCGGAWRMSLYNVGSSQLENTTISTKLNSSFSVSYYPPRIASISPNITYGSTLVNISGSNFGVIPSAVYAYLTAVSVLERYNCSNPKWQNSATIDCTIPSNLPAGNFSVSVVVGNQTSIDKAYVVNLLPPIITSISPQHGPCAGGTRVVLNVQNLYDFTAVEFFPSVNSYSILFQANSCFQSSINTINCTTPAVSQAAIYNVSISVQNVISVPFVGYSYDPAVVTSISSTSKSGEGGYNISIFGSNFGYGCCVTPIITFGSEKCTMPVRANDSLITCIAPKGFGSLIPNVQLNGTDLFNEIQFSYDPPTLLAINPAITYTRSIIELSLQYYGNLFQSIEVNLTSQNNLSVYPCLNSSFLSPSLITCTLPNNLPSGDFSVSHVIGKQNVAGQLYGLNLLPPMITSISPFTGPTAGGTSIVLTATNLVDFEDSGPTTINCTTLAVPISATYDVSITVGNISGPEFTGYTYDPAIITSISPNTGRGAGGDQISIVGKNFGTGCCVTALVVFKKIYSCLNPIRVNDTLITCTTPAGFGPVVPEVRLNGTLLNNYIQFTYYPPSISSISPDTGYGAVQLNVFGAEFGETTSVVQIDLKITVSPFTKKSCNSPTWQSSAMLFCTTPDMPPGNYSVIVTINGQSSNQTVILIIVNAPPPVAYDVEAFGEEATVQKNILIALNYTSALSSRTFFVSTLPKNGTLYQLANGVVGSQIQQGDTPLISQSLFYLPKQYFSGKDYFSYYVNDGSNSNKANVNVSISFTNQAPSFTSENYKLALNESYSTYSIDMLSLIFDLDEKNNYTVQFLSLPTRGNWKFNEERAFATNYTLLKVGSSNLLQVSLDQKGGANPYFTTTAAVYDSYGLVSTNRIEITGFITCNSNNALNTWGTGAICVPCPIGAVRT